MTADEKLPYPPERLVFLPDGERQAILRRIAASESSDQFAQKWLEKVRRFSSLYNRRLPKIARARFGKQSAAMLEWMHDLLTLALERRLPDSDARRMQMLNALLFLKDALRRGIVEQEIAEETSGLAGRLAGRSHGQFALPVFSLNVDRMKKESAGFQSKIAVFCPSPYSLYTLATIFICESLGIAIDAIVVRKFTASRVVDEWNRDGFRLLHKIWRKLVLRADENRISSDVSVSYLARKFSAEKNVIEVARRINAECIRCDDFNSGELISELSGRNLDFGLFTGGGLIAEATQRAFSRGLINVHMGHLPDYRGMDVVQWPVLENRPDAIGATAHFMDAGLDTGPAIQKLVVSPDQVLSLGEMRNAIAGFMPLVLVDSALGLDRGRLRPQPQPERRPLYYYMHRDLLNVVEDRLRKGSNSGRQAFQDQFTADVRAIAQKDTHGSNSVGGVR
jgi:hypothetical protein